MSTHLILSRTLEFECCKARFLSTLSSTAHSSHRYELEGEFWPEVLAWICVEILISWPRMAAMLQARDEGLSPDVGLSQQLPTEIPPNKYLMLAQRCGLWVLDAICLIVRTFSVGTFSVSLQPLEAISTSKSSVLRDNVPPRHHAVH